MSLDNLPVTVWMNVTSSANWNRPPVGIIRVEMLLARELEGLLGLEKFKRCIWDQNRFVEYSSTSRKAKRQEIGRGDILISIGLDWDQPYKEFFYDLRKTKNIRIVNCCYDLIPILFPQYCVSDVAAYFKGYFTRLTWATSAVLCISKQTQNDYLYLCNTLGLPTPRTCVITLGDNIPDECGDINSEIKSLCDDPFILFVSTIERRKNHEALYRAYHLLAKAGYSHLLPKLVFVGMSGWGVDNLLKDIELDPLIQGFVVQLHHVSDAELNLLYKKAFFCVFPSLYEGWGLPVAEALALGKAIIASNQGSLPEVGGDLVRYVAPWDVQGWADVILEWVQNPGLVEETENRVVKQYKIRKWTDTAIKIKELIEELVVEEESEVVLYPGYDFIYPTGLQIGPCLSCAGKRGFLMYGPYRFLKSGRYKIIIWDEPSARSNGKVTIDFVASKSREVFFLAEEYSVEVDNQTSKPLIEFEIQTTQDLLDYEIRCRVKAEQQLTLKRINIVKLPFISDLLDTIFFPGFGCCTQEGVGIYKGPLLIATGKKSGFLMFGRYQYLKSGRYCIKIFDISAARTNGVIVVDAVANQGRDILFVEENYSVVKEDGEKPLIVFDIQIEQDLPDVEIRCKIAEKQKLILKRVEIKQIS